MILREFLVAPLTDIEVTHTVRVAELREEDDAMPTEITAEVGTLNLPPL